MEKIWNVMPDAPKDFYEKHPELPKVVAQLLYHRNIRTQEKIDEFLNPDYSQDIHDPYLFKDMEKAVNRIFKAIQNEETITIHGDYDADGVCSSTILVSTLKAIGATKVDAFLPHRDTDGYGLNKKNIKLLSEEGTNLIITCDCGVSNIEEIDLANELNIDVIITDHHSVPENPPAAFAIIHPKVPGETYPDQTLCGAGVAFKLAQGLLKKHKETGNTLKDEITHEALEKWMLDLVAIASVADMVPLLGESRTLTKYGLIVLNKTRHVGMKKLLLEAKLMNDDGTMKKEFDANTIGFKLAPRINAAGRLNHANVAYKLLTTKDPIEATNLAFELEKNNRDRQKITEVFVKEAIEQIEEQKDNPIYFVYKDGWQTGIVGLIASKLKEQFSKPVIAMTTNDGEVMGSGRSITGFDLISSLREIPELFSKYGGHPMACGFTLADATKIEELKQKLLKKYQEKTKDKDMRPTIDIDTEVTLEEVNWDLYDVLEKFKPFGKDNPTPKYVAKGLHIHQIKPVGKDGRHLNLFVKHTTPKIKKMIGWSLCGKKDNKTNWCKILKPGDLIDVVFNISINEWNGNRELQLTIIDLKKSS